MTKELLLPRVKFFNRNRAANKAMLIDLVTKDLRRSTVMAPAKRSQIRFTKIDDDKTIATLDYKSVWVDAGVNRWRRLPNDLESTYRANSKATVQSELDAENAKQPDQQDADLITSLSAQIKQLSDGSGGYLMDAYGAMNTDTLGVFWRLAAPNIPVQLKSTFKLQKNRALCFRLQRGLKPEGQGDLYGFTIEIGNGTTLYAIEMGADGNKSTFIHYRNMTAAARETLLNQRDALLDLTRLTATDIAGINELEDLIKTTKAAGDNGAIVATAQSTIEDIKTQKNYNLNASQQNQLDTIENDLYLDRKQFQLQEDAESLLGRPIDITVEFLRAGYVVIRCDKSTFVYENKRLRGWKEDGQYGYRDGLPDKSQIVLKSDGGQFALVYGHPKYASRGELLTQPHSVPFTPNASDILISADADASNPGCDIDYQLRTYQTATSKAFGRYQVRVVMTGNNQYTPELFSAQAHIPPPAPDAMEEIWDSQIQGAKLGSNSGNRIMDFQMQDDAARARQVTLHIDNGFDKANLPDSLGGLAIEVLLQRGTDTPYTIMKSGRIVNFWNGGKIGYGSNAVTVADGTVVMTCVGLESFLDRQIDAQLVGDGKFPNDFLRELALDAGLSDSEYADIPIGDIGIPRIGRSMPGEKPAVQPDSKAHYWEYMQQITERHCIGRTLFYNGTSLELATAIGRDKTTSNYRNAPDVAVSDPQCIRKEISTEQSLGTYITKVTCTGAEDPITGKKISYTESQPQANDKRFINTAYYVGDEIPLEINADDGMNSQRDLMLLARQRLKISALTPQGATPWMLNFPIDFDPDVRAGDIRKVFGKKCIVDSIGYSSLNSGDGEIMNVKMQLAEDWT